MTQLAESLDYEIFISIVESLERNQRLEYITDNLSKVLGGDNAVLWKYAVEAREYWEKRLCSMLEFETIDELYSKALKDQLPKVERREKEVIFKLARALRDYSRLCDISALTDEPSITASYQAEALLKHINHKQELLALYINFSYAMRQRDSRTEVLTTINNHALAIAQELNAKNEEMQVLSNFGQLCEHNHDYAAALTYYLQALDILDGVVKANNVDDSPRTIPQKFLLPKAILLFNIGHCKVILGNIRDGITICHQAAAFAERLHNDNVAIHIELVLARAYSILGAHNTALEHLFRAEKLTETRNSPFLIGQNKIFIAMAYSKMGEFQKAIEYGLQAIPIYKLYESLATYIIISGRVGSFMVSAGEFEKAYQLFSELLVTIEDAEKVHNLDWHKSQTLRNLARIAIHHEQWDKAITYLHFPLSILDTEGNLPQYVIETLLIATDVYIGTKEYKKAENFAKQALKISEDSNDLQNQYMAHNQLVTIAEKQGEFSVAYRHHKEFHRLKEQVFNNESDTRNKNMIILLEQQEAVRSMQAERIRRFELEEEIGQLSSALVHREQALKEIRTALRSTKTSNEHAEQVVQVLQTVIRSSENTVKANSSKTYKQIDEKIELAFPTLTKIQRELCRFISLGHSTKDIARLLNVTVQSVNTQRYRVRTRLGLTEVESLDFIVKQATKQV